MSVNARMVVVGVVFTGGFVAALVVFTGEPVAALGFSGAANWKLIADAVEPPPLPQAVISEA